MAHGHRRVTACGVVRARMDDRREPFKRSLWLTSGPWLFSDFSRFSILQTLKSKSMTFPMSKLCQFLQVRQLETHGATFLFGTTSNSLRISSYNFWNKFKFESSLNFRGVQTFLEKSDKFSKILPSGDLHKSEFIWVYLYVRFQVTKQVPNGLV
jgi:hypothetical protein